MEGSVGLEVRLKVEVAMVGQWRNRGKGVASRMKPRVAQNKLVLVFSSYKGSGSRAPKVLSPL